jgi:hypothetical protein
MAADIKYGSKTQSRKPSTDYAAFIRLKTVLFVSALSDQISTAAHTAGWSGLDLSALAKFLQAAACFGRWLIRKPY